MVSFVVTLEEFFSLNREAAAPNNNFKPEKRKLLIPLYQREYKWKDAQVETLITDIISRDKFLGLIILDEKPGHYEIVDGQQRITTCFLTMMVLYNLYENHQLDQESILDLMQRDGSFVLSNESVGDFIAQRGSTMALNIAPENDVYNQEERFRSALEKIHEKLKAPLNKAEFVSKLKRCIFLVLINEEREQQTRPIEQVFMDFNEKSQRLDPEDLFKGHCFKNYTPRYHERLRQDWIRLKKIGIAFGGFGCNEFSEYLYRYFLSVDPDTTKELTINKRHILDDLTMTQTRDMLQDMISYGEANLDFFRNLNSNAYRFEDICAPEPDPRHTRAHDMAKKLAGRIMASPSKAQYQKLPLFFLIFKLLNDERVRDGLTFAVFEKIISNYYLYAGLFALRKAEKDKTQIARWIRRISGVIAEQEGDKPNRILATTREMRNEAAASFKVPSGYDEAHICFTYSVIDFYRAADNTFSDLYDPASLNEELRHTREHFIIPENRKNRIEWHDGGRSCRIVFPKEDARPRKGLTANNLILDKPLNESLGNTDIVTKIERITAHYAAEEAPRHAALFIRHIEGMEEFQALKALKGLPALTAEAQDEIRAAYFRFADAYFATEKQDELLEALKRAFQGSISGLL